MTAGPGIEPGTTRDTLVEGECSPLRQPLLSLLHAFVPFLRVFEDSVVFLPVVVPSVVAPFSVITIQGKQTHILQPLPLFGSLSS